MKKISLLIVFIVSSCDPMDNRMSIENNSQSDIYIDSYFGLGLKKKYGGIGRGKIKSKELKRIGIIGNWQAQFSSGKPYTTMTVTVYKDYNFLNEDVSNPHYYYRDEKTDSLLCIGAYEFHNYSYEDLEKRDWKIVYPDDGFIKGIPIKSNNR